MSRNMRHFMPEVADEIQPTGRFKRHHCEEQAAPVFLLSGALALHHEISLRDLLDPVNLSSVQQAILCCAPIRIDRVPHAVRSEECACFVVFYRTAPKMPNMHRPLHRVLIVYKTT
ncbi:hypothetical protein H310_01437 [Aphanomyces invadans]|uniref:Uncharacterized protein n=1 Tax=Aphanomyces invadans TaxID=157072 RepID=A0A024UTL4_9STRA|nr:hypothetical protein H310_01437 [Aphanomyces invadans]ETW08958.1 hypothetical protein H310_01437 [Aphanomyces invadans]|eukprot:XP_008862763.1 hypothetical protein H310_01437 [Aphanomyces invadans]